MRGYHNSTPTRDWSECTRCQLHTNRRNVVIRRSGLIHDFRIYHIQIDPPFPKAVRQLALQGITNARQVCSTNSSSSDISTNSSTSSSDPSLHVRRSKEDITHARNTISTSSNSSHSLHNIPHILFIGEAPGEVEDNTGLPFWGPAGNLLDQFLLPFRHMAPTFHSCYSIPSFFFTITNTVCCRPTKQLQYHKIGNRQPLPEEQEACKPHVVELLQAYQFDGVICLGVVASNYFKGFSSRLPTLQLTHPSALLREDYILLPLKKEKRKLAQWMKILK
jgi:uracil-DNA glycosylase family 4